MKPAAGQATTRICFERDIYLESADLLVPAGVSLRMPCHTLQNADFNWDEPRSFLPERWLEVHLHDHFSFRSCTLACVNM